MNYAFRGVFFQNFDILLHEIVLLIFDGRAGAASTPISDSQVNTGNTWSYVRPEFAGDRKFWISFRTEYSNKYVSCSTMTSDVSYDTLGGSVSNYQKIYYRSTQKVGQITVPAAPNKWETTNTEVNNNWTTHKMAATDDYPYVFSCTQYRTLGGAVQNTTVAIDTETVIDTENGFIKTNLIDVDNLLTRKATIKEKGEIVSENYQESVTTKTPIGIYYSSDGSRFSNMFQYQIKTSSPYTYAALYMRIYDTSDSYTEFNNINNALDTLHV